jgi:hypothetical protein
VFAREAVQVDDVLEDVGVQRSFGEREVRLDVVAELDDPDFVALAFQQRLVAEADLVRVRPGARPITSSFGSFAWAPAAKARAAAAASRVRRVRCMRCP